MDWRDSVKQLLISKIFREVARLNSYGTVDLSCNNNFISIERLI